MDNRNYQSISKDQKFVSNVEKYSFWEIIVVSMVK